MAQQKPALSMADFASGITDIGDSHPSHNILVYSEAGVGKTALLSELPNALLLGFDPGWATAKSLKRKCRVRPITDWETLQGGLVWLESGGYSEHPWVIADGCSILQDRLRQQFTREAWEENPAKRVSPYQPDKPDYFREQSVFKSIIARLCDLPTNVAFTFHASRGNDQDGDEWIRPHIAGRDYNVGNFCTGLVNCIGYMAPRSIKTSGKMVTVRRLLWEPYADEDRGLSIMAKDQLNVFPRIMDDPTGDQIHGMISDGDKEAPAGLAEEAAAPTARTNRRVNARTQAT